MKIFTNKSFFKKLIVVLILIVIISFCVPNCVRALFGSDDDDAGIGGKLLNPIMSLFVAFGDGVMTLLQSVFLGIEESIISISMDSTFWEVIKDILIALAIVAVVFIVISAALTSGVTLGVFLKFVGAKVVKLTLMVAGVSVIGFSTITTVAKDMLPNTLALPIFELTPEQIFKNEIPIFDVDFFNPMEAREYERVASQSIEEVDTYVQYEIENSYAKFTFIGHDFSVEIQDNTEAHIKYDIAKAVYDYIEAQNGETVQNGTHTVRCTYEDKNYQLSYIDGISEVYCNVMDGNQMKSFEFISVDQYSEDDELEGMSNVYVVNSTASELRNVISKWYVVLRNIAIVVLLSVLVYIGIRIILSSTSSDKAKYKQFLQDWVVAMCLLFVMHYIMAFSNTIVQKITEIVSTTNEEIENSISNINEEDTDENNPQTMLPAGYAITDEDAIKKAYEVLVGDLGENSKYYYLFVDNAGNMAGEDATIFVWPAENFMQQVRLDLQFLGESSSGEYSITYRSIGYKLIYVVLVAYTVIFVFTYVKRVLYMAFLTIIAPLVAMTYPIDKMNDGSAQAFNSWLKEYIFNLLIQPMHLLLYVILISSALEFASQNIIYVIVALGFMIPAEKLLRSFFGFEKAKTPGLLAGPAGTALMWSGLNKVMGHRPKNKSENKDSRGDNSDEDTNSTRFSSNFDADDAMTRALGASSDSGKDLAKEPIQKEETKPEDKKEEQGITPATTKGTTPKKRLRRAISNAANYVARGKDTIKNKIKKRQGNSTKKKHRILRPFKALKGGAKYYARGMGKKIIQNAKNSHPIREVGGAIGAATFAAAGGITGLVSGDPTKAFQYGTAGAIGGWNFGKGVVDGVSSTLNVPGTMEAAKRGYYDTEEEYQDAQRKKYVKKMQKDSELREKFERELNLTSAESKELMESDFIERYTNAGITDEKDLIAGYKLENGIDKKGRATQTAMDSDEAIATIRFAKRVGKDTKNMVPKDRDEWKKKFDGEINGVPNAGEEVLKRLDRYNDLINN